MGSKYGFSNFSSECTEVDSVCSNEGSVRSEISR